MIETIVVVSILAAVAVAMVVWAKRRNITELSSQEEKGSPPVRDRPAGPEAESMDADELGGHRSTGGTTPRHPSGGTT